MWGDGLVVKALKCSWEGCGFKPYLEHSSLKKSPKFGDSMVCTMSTDVIC